MSGRDGDDAEQEAENVDRLDALLSARMDDDLTPEERVELEALITNDPDYAVRALAFEKVDAQLRSLAEASIDEDRLADAYAGLRARLAIGELDETDPGRTSGQPTSRIDLRSNSLGGPVIPLLLAIAAAFILYLVVPAAPPSHVDEPGDLATASNGAFSDIDEDFADVDLDVARGVEDELILVLGYGDEMSVLQGITRDDLDVIEQLELLDFLSDREQALGESGEMGERG